MKLKFCRGNPMKIIVDQLPESPKYCLFAEPVASSMGYGLWHKCKLSGVSCYSYYGDPCPFLIAVDNKTKVD